MAKEEKAKKAAEQQNDKTEVTEGIRVDNMMTDSAIENAMKEIEKEKDDRKKRDAKRALCIATYVNRKTVLQLQQRRREDDITKEKLDESKTLLERLIGFKTTIEKGQLVPTKDKIEANERLTPSEFERETQKMNEAFAKKVQESDKTYRDAITELRNSYEGEYRYCIRDYWD